MMSNSAYVLCISLYTNMYVYIYIYTHLHMHVRYESCVCVSHPHFFSRSNNARAVFFCAQKRVALSSERKYMVRVCGVHGPRSEKHEINICERWDKR